MTDAFASHTSSLTSPAADAADVTPSDSTDLQQTTRAIYIGQSGDLRVEMVSGTIVTLTAVAAGAIYPLRANKVMATGTTAGAIIGLY